MYLILVIALLALFGVWKFFGIRKEETIRQCAYGNSHAYEILKNSNKYELLKKHMSEANSFQERYFYTVCISRLFPMKTLESWVNDEPQSADALLCYGARLVQWSWNARGYGRGAQVSSAKWKIFFESMKVNQKVNHNLVVFDI